MSTPIIVEDIRPLIALIAPWFGLIGIMLAGEKRANLRELITFAAASVQAAVVLSMLPIILGGSIIEFHIWQIFSYVPMLLRVDGPGLLFALVASILWIATTLYSIGYMRGLHEHAQTRFYSFFRNDGGCFFRQPFDHLFLLRNALRFHFPSSHSYAG